MRIGLFFDYDGVLAPITVDPSGGKISPEMLQLLERLSRKYAISVVSGRDCPYLYSRVPGLAGYACVFGLEIHGGGYVVLDKEVYTGSRSAHLDYIRSILHKVLKGKFGIIHARASNGAVLGVSIYWMLSDGRPAGIEALVEEAKSRGLYVSDIGVWGDFAEYISVFVSKRTKQDSIRILKTLMNVDKVIYFGDADGDIPAFSEADVSIFVKHRYNSVPSGIKINYIVKYEDLPLWILNNIDEIASILARRIVIS